MRSYYTETVVAFTSRDMEVAMDNTADIDEMAQCHVKYVAKLQERALLSDDLKPIHKAVIELFDLGVLFAKVVTDVDETRSGRTRPSAPRRKSSVPLLSAADSSGSEDDAGESEGARRRGASTRAAEHNPQETLRMVDKEFTRLLPFLTAGLRSVGRVGAEPMWEQLAERLEWEGMRNRQ